MKKAKSVALIGAGKLTDSPLSRFYWLSDRLGPVKSSSYRLASRIANQLRAGHPVKGLDEFARLDLILGVRARRVLPRWWRSWRRPPIQLRGKAVVLCSFMARLAANCTQLSDAGAAGGVHLPIPGFDDLRYLMEGDRRRCCSRRKSGGTSRPARRNHRAHPQAFLSRRAHLHRQRLLLRVAGCR